MRPATLEEIPVIDISSLDHGGNEELAKIAREIGSACESTGFFYITGHGIPMNTIDSIFTYSERYFEQDIDIKRKIAFNNSHRGYRAIGTITIPGYVSDHKEVLDFGPEIAPDHPDCLAGRPLHGPNQWPDIPGFRNAMEVYYEAVKSVGFRLLKPIAMSLDLEESFFLPFHRDPFATWRIMRYPPDRNQSGQFGTAPHTDFGTITLLMQDSSGGLQVYMGNDTWIEAPWIEGSLVVNIGDFLSFWTNDRFQSTAHRVINGTERYRYSIPLFYNPSFDTVASCLPTCHGPGNPPRYEPISYGEYVARIYSKIFSRESDS